LTVLTTEDEATVTAFRKHTLLPLDDCLCALQATIPHLTGSFKLDKARNVYICPANKILTTTGTVIDDGETLRYLASTSDSRGCPLKVRCCPNASFRRIPRSVYEQAAMSPARWPKSRRERKRVEMLFTHLKRILRLGRLRLRGPRGAQDEFTLAAIAQNLRRLAKAGSPTAIRSLRLCGTLCERRLLQQNRP
jgi:hypothetical protein